ncbi:hypothetical protein PBRA_007769 [Plasmodiophora brassicae]|uniref:GRIP domain-containing protein n=1 Tax=Plasmodiophora brassicae TaxID=37360 RepID=A0A0G4IXI4_PLABS|nr:hypothetical protein PBRA_007769 [Plasmodiophora brassicae]
MTPGVREYVEGLKKKSQADAKRLVALLKKRAEKEKLELVNDYEQQLKQLAGQRSQALAGAEQMKTHGSSDPEMAAAFEQMKQALEQKEKDLQKEHSRMAGVTNMVQQLKQARATLMERLEQQETTNQTLREQIARLESRPNDELKALQEISSGYAEELAELKGQLDSRTAKINELTSALDQEQSGAVALRDQLQATAAALAASQGDVATLRAVAAEKSALERRRSPDAKRQTQLDTPEATRHDLQEPSPENALLHSQIASLQADLDAARSQIANLHGQLDAQQSSSSTDDESLTMKLDRAQSEALALRGELQAKKAELVAARDDLATLREQLASANAASEAARADTAALQKVRAQLSKLETTQQDLQESRAENASLTSEVASLRADLDAARLQISDLRSQLDTAHSSKNAELDKLVEERDTLKTKVKRLRMELESSHRAREEVQADANAAAARAQSPTALQNLVHTLQSQVDQLTDENRSLHEQLTSSRANALSNDDIRRTAEVALSNSGVFQDLVSNLNDELQALQENEVRNASLIASLEGELGSVRAGVCESLLHTIRHNATDSSSIVQSLSADIDVLNGARVNSDALIDELRSELTAARDALANQQAVSTDLESQLDRARRSSASAPESTSDRAAVSDAHGDDVSAPHSSAGAAVSDADASSSLEVLLEEARLKVERAEVDNDMLRSEVAQLRAQLHVSRSLLRSLDELEHRYASLTGSRTFRVVTSESWDALRHRVAAVERLTSSDHARDDLERVDILSGELDKWKQFADHLLSALSYTVERGRPGPSSSADGTGDDEPVESLKRMNARLKHVLKEQVTAARKRADDESEKYAAMEKKWLEEKKKVAQFGRALKKYKEEAKPDDEKVDKDHSEHVQAALFRAQTAETQVLHLSKSIEMLELAHGETQKEKASISARLEQADKDLQSLQERHTALEGEKQKLKACLIRANKCIAEMKTANASLTVRNQQLSQIISSHWLSDITPSEDASVQVEINQRCKIGDQWWLFVHLRQPGAEGPTASFWTTVAAFDAHSPESKRIMTGNVSDLELAREACTLSSGVSLPRSIDFQSETNLKAKFDKKWDGAARKFERKVADLNAELERRQNELEQVRREFSEYKAQATRVLQETSGDSVRMAELQDEIDALREERDALRRAAERSSSETVDRSNAEIIRLQRLVEAGRKALHDAEVKWSAELQSAHLENERLVLRQQQEESSVVAALDARLKAAQDDLQRNRSAATQIIRDRDTTIGELHLRISESEETVRDLQRQARMLQGEVDALRQSSSSSAATAAAGATGASPRRAHPDREPEPTADQSANIARLQSLLREAEIQNATQAAQIQQLHAQIREVSKSSERSGANLEYDPRVLRRRRLGLTPPDLGSYLKHVIVKYMETDEQLALLPVISNILAFDADEVNRIQRKLEADRSSLIPRIW